MNQIPGKGLRGVGFDPDAGSNLCPSFPSLRVAGLMSGSLEGRKKKVKKNNNNKNNK